jgi:dTDP-4-amino-4,6-dideoxygalactose transaminase
MFDDPTATASGAGYAEAVGACAGGQRARKAQLEELAILGGAAAFPEPLHVGRPNLGDRSALHARIDGILDRRWLTNLGPLVLELEERLAALTGARHAVTTSSATLGLQVAAHSLGLTGEVIVPAFTFVASAHALRWIGLEPVLCDIRPDTHTIDPRAAEALITERTSAILGVHLWGRACDIGALTDIADRHGLRLLFDAAHALGCTHEGRPIGGFGDAEVFSFHATKFLNAFEGGAITTDDDDLAARLRLASNFGFADWDTVVQLGTNSKMSEASAAMGLTSLEAAEDILHANERNLAAYRDGLADVPGLSLLEFDPAERHNHQYVVAEVDAAVAGLPRDVLLDVLVAENVWARRYFYPGVHRMEPYLSAPSGTRTPLPVTEAVAGRVLVLPTGTAIGPEEIAVVCGIIRFAIAESPALLRALR